MDQGSIGTIMPHACSKDEKSKKVEDQILDKKEILVGMMARYKAMKFKKVRD